MHSDQPCADCKVNSLDMKQMNVPEVFSSDVAKRMIAVITWNRPVLDAGLIWFKWADAISGGLTHTVPAALGGSLTIRFMLKAFNKTVGL